MSENNSKLTIGTPEQRRFGIIIVNFQEMSDIILVLLLI